jgi:hypothetical protein
VLHVAALVFCIAQLASPASAQMTPLERERQAVFAQLLAAPADRALMLHYARLSVQLRDFEAAAATLERFVDLYPGDVVARTELAVAYFALGAYDVADYHLAAVEASGALPADQADRIARYRAEAASRGAPGRLSGQIALGQSWTRQQSDESLTVAAQLEWRLDMGGRNADDWVTQFGYQANMPGVQTFNDRSTAQLRTGPEFRLTGDAFGPRLRPYLELVSVREADTTFAPFTGDYTAAAFGLSYRNTIEGVSILADIAAGQTIARDAPRLDFDFREATFGLGYSPIRDTTLRAVLRWRQNEDAINTETLRGVRLELGQAFDLGAENLVRRVDLRAYVLRELTERDFAGVVTDFTDTGYGASLRATLGQGLFVEARGSRLERESVGVVQPETVYALQLGWEF